MICLWGVMGPKKIIRADDSLDVLSVHALGGISGALLTGIFNAPRRGELDSIQDRVNMTMGYPGIPQQLLIQAKAVGITIVWTTVVAFIAFKIAELIVDLRVTEEQEREGLDISSHGESAYDSNRHHARRSPMSCAAPNATPGRF